MKKTLFLTIMILFGASFTVFAQPLKVTSFYANSRDLSASRFEKKDINGVPCGLIKVWLPMSDVKFVGNVLDYSYKNGEWWVYMTKGSKRVTIKTSKYPPLCFEFVEKRIQIQSNVTYVMTVELPVALTKGFLKLKGDKELLSSAVLTIDGKEEKYEEEKPYELGIGTHKVCVLLDCYKPFEQMVDIKGGELDTLRVELEAICAMFTLESDENAWIYVDGVKKGKGYLSTKLDFGKSYKFESRKFGRFRNSFYKSIDNDTDRSIAMPQTQSKPSRRPAFFITGNIAYGFEPQLSYGFSFGVLDYGGLYISILSNFKFYTKDGDCDAQGYLEDGSYPGYKDKQNSRLSITGGIIVPLYEDIFTLRVGGGYGMRNLYWETSDGTRYRNLGYSVNGFDGSLGLQFCFSRVVISADYVVTKFKFKQFSEIKIGAGFSF